MGKDRASGRRVTFRRNLPREDVREMEGSFFINGVIRRGI
jgi:hypothetical protein